MALELKNKRRLSLRYQKLIIGMIVTFFLIFTSICFGQQKTKSLTIDEAVKIALEKNLDIESSNIGIEASELDQKASRALYGPRLMIDSQAFYFNERTSFDLNLGGSDLQFPDPTPEQIATWDQGDLSVLQYLQTGLGSAFSNLIPSGPMEVGEQYSWNISIKIAQPLTKLYGIYHLNEIKSLGIDISKIQLEQKKVELAAKVRKTYYQILIAKNGKVVLSEALKQIDAQLLQAKVAEAAGILKRGDVLRAEVGKAQIEQKVIAVDRAIVLAKQGLKNFLNINYDVDLVEIETSDEFNGTLQEYQQKAMENRTELKELSLKLQQVQHSIKAKMQDFLPDISLVGQYQHAEGSSMEQPAFAIGGILSWTPWAWGETYYSYKQLQKQEEQLRTTIDYLKTLIDLDVQSSFTAIEEKQDLIKVAKIAIQSSEESLRVEKARYEVGDVTNTEVLTAITNLAQANLDLITLRYGYLQALSDLKKSSGEY